MTPEPDETPGPSDKAERLRGLRRKLAKLNRRELPEGEPSPQPASEQTPPAPATPSNAIVFRRDLPRVEPKRVPEGGGICIPLERCVEGCEVHCPRGLPFFLIECSVSEFEPDATDLHATIARALEALARCQPRNGGDPIVAAPEDVVFLDLETTGLASSPLFLIGTLVCRDGDVIARQLLARNYAEEISILDRFAEEARRRPVFVTFNGKTFDVPYLRVRSVATGVRFCEPRHHLDLLHAARRLYRRRLPDCKLQTLERYVCQRHRGDDIPGSEIPRAYHDFVRTGDARELAQIVAHNRHDLVTMVHLLSKILLAPKDVTRDA